MSPCDVARLRKKLESVEAAIAAIEPHSEFEAYELGFWNTYGLDGIELALWHLERNRRRVEDQLQHEEAEELGRLLTTVTMRRGNLQENV